MNETPTSGPMPISSTHQARDTSSSRHSFASSQTNGAAPLCAALGERKKHLFEIVGIFRGLRRQLRYRSLASHASAAQQHEAVAEARRFADLVNREEQRPAAPGMGAQCRGDLARLPQVEPIERL